MDEHTAKRDEVTVEFLDAFADAWNRHDTDAILSMMTPDCIMQMPVGPEVCGTRYVGVDEVRIGVERVFSIFPDVKFDNLSHFVSGNRGLSQWVLTATGPNGPVETEGCDLFTFQDGKVKLKNSFRKQRVI